MAGTGELGNGRDVKGQWDGEESEARRTESEAHKSSTLHYSWQASHVGNFMFICGWEVVTVFAYHCPSRGLHSAWHIEGAQHMQMIDI